MNQATKLFFLLLLSGTMACTPARQLTQVSQQAHDAYTAEDYQRALLLYETVIQDLRAQGEMVGGENFNRAGLSAWAVGDTAKALEYLDAARHTDAATPQTFAALAKAYKGRDNLSREITSLEEYLRRNPESPESDVFRKRLFITYVESMNWQQADGIWPALDQQVQNSEEVLNGYFLMQKNLGNEALATESAKELLKRNENNTNALEWLAERHYWLAENRYQSEMRAYEKNRTNRQYARLLEAFEILNTDFKISLNYFLRLYSIDPSKSHAMFIGNIYMRFEDKEKADFYHRKAK